MTADRFRALYDYHFAANRTLWDYAIVGLPDDVYLRPSPYSLGSIRNHLVHMVDVDRGWFVGLRGVPFPGDHEPDDLPGRAELRAYADEVEGEMRGYLATLTDVMLDDQPFIALENDPIRVWQTLLHVVNHSTDHRAQVLALLHAAGAPTLPQDYCFFASGEGFL